MKIETIDDAISFLLHNSNIFLNIIFKIKTAFDYGRGIKDVCKYFKYIWNKNNKDRLYDKYELMQIGKIANSYSWDYIHKNKDKFYLKSKKDKNVRNIDDTDVEFIGYYQSGVHIIKIIEKIKFLIRNRNNGLTLPKCTTINIPSFMHYVFSWEKNISGKFQIESRKLIHIFENSKAIMYDIYENSFNQSSSDNNIGNLLRKLLGRPYANPLRIESIVINSTDFDYSISCFSIKDNVLKFKFSISDISFNNKNDIVSLLVKDNRDTSDACNFKEVDINYLVNKKVLDDSNTYNISLGENTFHGLSPNVDIVIPFYKNNKPDQDVLNAFKMNNKTLRLG